MSTGEPKFKVERNRGYYKAPGKKTQRIAALENEVAELRRRIEELEARPYPYPYVVPMPYEPGKFPDLGPYISNDDNTGTPPPNLTGHITTTGIDPNFDVILDDVLQKYAGAWKELAAS